MTGELVAYKGLSKDAYFLTDRRPPAQQFGKRAADHQLDTAATLIVVSLLSLGFWAAIWVAVASLFSAAL
jgi:hypothetical protein